MTDRQMTMIKEYTNELQNYCINGLSQTIQNNNTE